MLYVCTKFNGRWYVIMDQQNQKAIWLPLIASVGVGAATFYSMTKSGKGMGQAISQMVPFVAGMKNKSSQQSNQQTSTHTGHMLQ